MLRKSLVALLVGVIGASGACAGDGPVRESSATGIVSWLKSRGDSRKTGEATSARGIERAVVRDAEKQSVVRRTSGGQQDHGGPGAQAIQQAPVVPNTSTVSGPQYFSAVAPGSASAMPLHPGQNWQTWQSPLPVRPVGAGQVVPAPAAGTYAGPVYSSPAAVQPGYPQTGASLYPAPIPGIPHQVGGTAVMNPAFQPHEMLYGHEYRALYPPYYYQVNGEWLVTPFGVWSQEHWKLKGTEVNVRYRTSVSPFSFFTPPALR